MPALDRLPPQHPVAAAHHMQLLISQRAEGALTIGDTHDYDEPFDFAVDEAPYDHLRERAESLLGRPLPPVVRRWAGVYSQALHDAVCWQRPGAARRVGGHRAGRPGHDAVAGHRRGHVERDRREGWRVR